MLTAAVSELKASLSRFLARVKAGEDVIVTERGRPVARLVPVERVAEDIPVHLLGLQRKGVVRIGSAKLEPGFWDLPRPVAPGSATLEALLDERKAGR